MKAEESAGFRQLLVERSHKLGAVQRHDVAVRACRPYSGGRWASSVLTARYKAAASDFPGRILGICATLTAVTL